MPSLYWRVRRAYKAFMFAWVTDMDPFNAGMEQERKFRRAEAK